MHTTEGGKGSLCIFHAQACTGKASLYIVIDKIEQKINPFIMAKIRIFVTLEVK